MADNIKHIRQLTPFSEELESVATETIQVYIGNKEYVSREYYVIPASLITGSSSTPICKIGYVCEPKGMNFPIVLETGNTARIIYLGKNGIYEAMEEFFLDENARREYGDEEVEELDCLPEITEIKVPKDIQFTLDCVYMIYY
jgi:hypothetical protein